jgi:hypothetical protein
MSLLLDRVLALGPAIRYAALADGAEIVTRLRPDIADGAAAASASETDRYEELLVNPAVLLLTRRRGQIDCGGLDYVVVGYGHFHQLLLPMERGHLSVAIEKSADPAAFITPIRRLIATGSGKPFVAEARPLRRA